MMNLLRNIRIVFAQYREYQTVLAELGSYTDRELAEIGLARGDVPRLAYVEAERRVSTGRRGRGAGRRTACCRRSG
jgi:uncharacterized protein YjiS (DUF1127 family)